MFARILLEKQNRILLVPDHSITQNPIMTAIPKNNAQPSCIQASNFILFIIFKTLHFPNINKKYRIISII